MINFVILFLRLLHRELLNDARITAHSITHPILCIWIVNRFASRRAIDAVHDGINNDFGVGGVYLVVRIARAVGPHLPLRCGAVDCHELMVLICELQALDGEEVCGPVGGQGGVWLVRYSCCGGVSCCCWGQKAGGMTYLRFC